MAKSAVLDLLGKLRKDYKGALPSVDDAGIVHRLIMSSPKLNYIFGGGYPIGRIVELFGGESGGKSVVSSYIGGEFQKKGTQDVVLFVDMEHSFDKKYANTVGLDTDEENGKFIFIRPLDGEEAFTIVEEFVKTGEIGLVIWDSTSTTPTKAAMTDEVGKRSFGGAGLLFAEGLKRLNPHLARNHTSLILLTQMRANIGGGPHGPAEKPSGGGNAPKFYASWRAFISRGEDYMDKTETIGNQIRVRNKKSKIGFPKRMVELDLYYSTGFNPDMEYIDFIIDLELCKKAGSWFSNEEWGMKVQGRDKLLTFLLDRKELFADLKAKVNASFTGTSLLDEKHILLDDDTEEEEDGNLPDSD